MLENDGIPKNQVNKEPKDPGGLRSLLADPVNELMLVSVLTFVSGIMLGQLSDRAALSITAEILILAYIFVLMGLWVRAAYRVFSRYFDNSK